MNEVIKTDQEVISKDDLVMRIGGITRKISYMAPEKYEGATYTCALNWTGNEYQLVCKDLIEIIESTGVVHSGRDFISDWGRQLGFNDIYFSKGNEPQERHSYIWLKISQENAQVEFLPVITDNNPEFILWGFANILLDKLVSYLEKPTITVEPNSNTSSH